MNLLRKIASFFMASILILSSGAEAFAGSSVDDALNKVNLYVKEEKGAQLLTWKGLIDSNNFAAAVITYKSEDGKELPAYCANPNRPGIEDMVAKTYDVDIDQLDTDPHVWGVITNGYPYKSPAELGVRNDYEAYYATKMAVWAVVHDNYSNLDDWRANGEQNKAVETAMKNLVATGRENKYVYASWLSLTPKKQNAQDDNKESNYVSQEYTITSNVEIESYKVVLEGDVPSGTKVTDMDNNVKDSFNGTTQNFKVLVPKPSGKVNINFKVIAKSKLENKAVLFGLSHSAQKQDYYVAPTPTYNGDTIVQFRYEDGTEPPEPPENPDLPTATQGLQILKVRKGTTQGLPGAVFKLTDPDGGVLGYYVTDKNGEISIPDMPVGSYYVEETVPPYGYVLDEQSHKDIVVEADKPTVVTFSNEEMAELEILKVDADTGVKLSGATIRVAYDGGHDSFDVYTNASGKATLTNLKSGTYTVTEITAPEGYLLNTTPQSIKLEPGKSATITLKNQAKPGLIIKKYDEDTAMPLPDAEFSVAKKGGSIVYEGITDRNGQIKLEELKEGWYTITEIAAPKGYLIATESKDVYLEPNKVVEVKFDNRLRPSLQIMKIDAQTGEALAGAKFKVTKTEDKTVSEYVTDKTGTIVIRDLDEAVYTVEEVEAPEGYRIDSNSHKDIALEWGKTKTLVFSDTRNPALEIQKIDSHTKKPLAGAKFKVTKTEDNTVSEYLTDEEGKITINNLTEGIYTIDEITAPTGYIIDTQHKEIELEAGKLKTLIYENTKKPTLIVTKINVLTQKPVPNTVFKIQRETDNGGVITLGTYKTNKNGQIIIKDTEPGWYVLTETRAAEGMSKPTNPVTRKYLAPAENAYPDGIDNAEDMPYIPPVPEPTLPDNGLPSNPTPPNQLPQSNVVITSGSDYNLGEEVPNFPLNSIVIKKTDANTSEMLAGAVFEVRRVSGDISGNSGTIIGRYTTDTSGIIVITGLEAGAYIIEEVKAPTNYLISENSQQQAWLKADGTSVVENTFTNYPYGSLLITKLDSKTKQPLANVSFLVETADGTVVGNGDGIYKTDSRGEILIPHLKPGSYVVKEEIAPENYQIDSVPKTIQIGTDGKTYKLEFLNNPYGSLQIIKIDGVTKKPLPGAEFQIVKKGDSTSYTKTTDSNGQILMSNVLPDTYIVTEVKAPEGYAVVDTPHTVVVDADGEVHQVTVANYPHSSVLITKVDGNNKPLANAKFKVITSSGAVVGNDNGEYVTNNNGEILIPNVPPGSYVVTELQAPEGYALDDTPQTIKIGADGKIYRVNFANYPYGALLISKVDASNNKPLSNARFKVTDSEGKVVGNDNGEYLTNTNGEILVPNLKPGSYIVTELEAPQGYELDTTPQTFKLKADGKTYKVYFQNQPTSTLVVLKKDYDSGEPLQGARFKVTTSKGEVVGNTNGMYLTDSNGKITITGLEKGSYILEETQAPQGYALENQSRTVLIEYGKTFTEEFTNKKLTSLIIKKEDDKSGEPLGGARFVVEKQTGGLVGEYTTGKDGTINVPILLPDWYIIREKKSPDGYLLDETPKTVEVKTNVPTVVTFTNKKLTALEIIKKADGTGKPLSGAKFAVEKQNGERVGEYTTDQAGIISIPTLDPDWYVVKEIQAPDGFLLDETPKTVEVKTDSPTVVTFINRELAALQIKKVDEFTGAPLTGALFKVAKQNGELVGEYTTEKDGFINVPTLQPGHYSVSEMKAPEGYILDSTPKTVEIVTGRPTIATFSNKPLAGLKIIKLDSVTREPLEGVEFAVAKMNGEKIGNFKTNTEGMIYIEKLPDGYYTVTEIKGLEGYHSDKEPKTVQVVSGKQAILEITNEPYAALVIKKTSSKDNKPIEGVEFLVTKFNGEQIGYFKTDDSGRITINGLSEGTYIVKETKEAKGFQIDSEAREVEIKDGKKTLLEVENDPLSSVLIRKIDSVTGEGIYGVKFILYDSDNAPIGEFVSDDEGYVWIRKELPEGKYKLREIEPAEGYLPDDKPKTLYVQKGRTTEITWENTPQVGQIVITKRSSEFNDLTGLPAGSPLSGAVFEVYNITGNLVDKIVSDDRGIAASKGLPTGVYTIKETTAPRYYALNTRELIAEIRHNGDIVRFELLNSSVSLNLTVQKKGPAQTSPGQIINYELYEIANDSSGVLESFYIHDRIPTDAVRATKMTTGTYSERMYYKVTYKTNYRDYRVLAENLLTKNDYEYSLHPNVLGLQNGEYVTDIRLEFPKASPGFKQTKSMMVFCQVLPSLPKDYHITNRADVGGRYGNEWESAKKSWNTTVWAVDAPAVKLPKTGY